MFLLGCCVVLWLVSISLGFYPPALDCILGFLENFDSENYMFGESSDWPRVTWS
jgi:hypothetical protein